MLLTCTSLSSAISSNVIMAYTDNFTLYSVLLPFLVFVSYDDCFYLVHHTLYKYHVHPRDCFR